ncbi:MAG: hypothetical protein RL641_483 [Candidatus Parcubacteria bacterium]|jgi:Fe2+ transport system protein B
MFKNDLFTNFEFEKFSNTDPIENSVKQEYIKEMIALAKSDKQGTFFYFAFNLTAIVFLVEKFQGVVREVGFGYFIVFCLGILLLCISSVFFFTYWRKVHRYHINVVSCIPTLNIERARDFWIETWEHNKRYFKAGFYCMTTGLTFVVAVALTSLLLL